MKTLYLGSGITVLAVVMTIGCLTLSFDYEANNPLLCKPVVLVTGIDYTEDPYSVPYHDAHSSFAGNYTGSDLSFELRNATIEHLIEQADALGENTSILYESIKVTYDIAWDDRPYRIPCYAEKAVYANESVWVIAFNRCNGFTDDLGHFDLYFVSIATLEMQFYSGCNATAILGHFGCR